MKRKQSLWERNNQTEVLPAYPKQGTGSSHSMVYVSARAREECSASPPTGPVIYQTPSVIPQSEHPAFLLEAGRKGMLNEMIFFSPLHF